MCTDKLCQCGGCRATNDGVETTMANIAYESVKPTLFRQELAKVINKFSMEDGSNIPDYILADYLANCLKTFDMAIKARNTSLSKSGTVCTLGELKSKLVKELGGLPADIPPVKEVVSETVEVVPVTQEVI